MTTKKNILIGQSGGPTAVINASLCGIVKEGLKHKDCFGEIYGMINGIEGFLSDHYMNLSQDLSEEELQLLAYTPAAYLGSCRFKLPEDFTSPIYVTLFEKLQALNIGVFFYIGGNDSMDTASKLSRYAAAHKIDICFLGIPKTIDNDLVLTDHTPGYGSAAKYVASTVREIVLDSSVYQQKSVTIIELMGRHAGWLTAASVLARKHALDNPVLIYLPEVPFSLEQFKRDIEAAFTRQNNLIICVSEGIQDAKGHFLCEYTNSSQVDNFGHKMLTGCGKILENYVKEQFHVKVRSVELNVCQRCSGMMASQTDIDEAMLAGSFGVLAAMEGKTGCMISFERDADVPYQMHCSTQDVNQICNREKCIPSSWICESGNDLTEDFLRYVTPLIQGEAQRVMENGLPKYLYRK
ncbi:MAG: 6-phosphofructokinase [bacterium]|nr:6-phosphofructokinase [bacterium]